MSANDDAYEHVVRAVETRFKDTSLRESAIAQVYATLAVADRLERIEELLEVLAGVTRKDK